MKSVSNILLILQGSLSSRLANHPMNIGRLIR
jgi:hypothetical protein